MRAATVNGITLHFHDDGSGAPVVFCNALGTDLRLWDGVVARLPAGLRTLRYDRRGHGLSDAPAGTYAMGTLIRDAEALMDLVGMKGAVYVGCSMGGMVAQGLAVKRPDRVSALVLSNTAARIGTTASWQERAAAVQAGGVAALSEATLARWFARPFRDGAEARLLRNMLERTPPQGYIGCAAAIGGTDFYTTTASLRIPVLAIAGSNDGSTPPDLVRETAALVPGARFELIRGAGHLPMVDHPDAFAALLVAFLEEIGHV